MEEKEILRSQCRAQAKACPLESLAICQRILQLSVYQNAKSVLAFYPMKTEPDIRPVLEACLQAGKQLYLPQTDEMLQIHPRQVCDLLQLRRGRFGIWEPEESQPEEKNISVILVPALAYDRQLYRLGQGAGCYDRFLPESSGVRIGVCFDAFLMDQIPHDSHDQPVHILCTQSQTIVK